MGVRDLLLVVWRALALLGRFAADRLATLAGRREAVPRDLDARWLTEALGSSFADPRVCVRDVTPLGGHAGTTRRERIRVSYAAPAPEGGRDERHPPALPATLFVKTTPRDLGTRVFGGLFALGENEVGFYRHVRPDLSILTPRCFCARSGPAGRFILLLEDLQERGARFATLEDPVSLDQARAVVRTLAALHAAFWRSPRFRGDLAWVKSHATNQNLGVERWISARANAPAIARHADVLSAAVQDGAARIHERRNDLEAYWSEAPLTLVHGDSHVGNMFFIDDEAGLLDWQVLQQGQGIRDVAYFMMNSLDTDLRRAHERDLVASYLAHLAENGVSPEDLDPEKTWERYRSHALYVWIASTVTAATPGLQPEPVARRGMERAGSALDDLQSLALLDSIAASGPGS